MPQFILEPFGTYALDLCHQTSNEDAAPGEGREKEHCRNLVQLIFSSILQEHA
jgi:hypothetical protein